MLTKWRIFFLVSFSFLAFVYQLLLTGFTNQRHLIRTSQTELTELTVLLQEFVPPGEHHESPKLLLDTIGCKLPYIFDRLSEYQAALASKIACDEHDASVTYVRDGIVKVNDSVVRRHGNTLSYCDASRISRTESADSWYSYGVPTVFVERFEIPADWQMLRVRCFNIVKRLVGTSFHVSFGIKPNVHRRPALQAKNVLLIGIDSVSRQNFHRYMKQTGKLLQTIGAIEYVGYNKVGDNTFPNLIPLLTGLSLEDIQWGDQNASAPLDKLPFLWKLAKQRGYETLLMEDQPEIAIFNYLKLGFQEQPTDFYLRPLSLAMEDDTNVWPSPFCLNGRLESAHLMDVMSDFVGRAEQSHFTDPFFAISFLTRLTHDKLSNLLSADQVYYDFLFNMASNKRLDRTWLVFFSDHGMRFGDILKTPTGRLEERLPFLFIRPPSEFRQKHPQLYRNLTINSKRLVTPFDLHETIKLALLHDYAAPSDLKETPDSRPNLFSEISPQRTCAEARIPAHWCACDLAKASVIENPSENPVAKLVSSKVVDFINQKLLKANLSGLCLSHQLTRIIDVRVTKGSSHSGQITFEFRITIETYPNDAQYSATVIASAAIARSLRHADTVSFRHFHVLEDISRLNSYGTDADCTANYEMRKFCYCIGL